MQITDKVFVVTGGGNGIGREVVLALLARGGLVAAVDLSRDGLDETTELARTSSADRLSTHAVDLTDRAAVEALPDAVREAHGRIDGLVNVAGIIQPFVKFADLEYAQMEKVLSVNLWGVIHTCKVFLPAPRRPSRGVHRQRLEHGRPRAGPRPDDLRREQGRGQAVHRGPLRRAARHHRRRHGGLSRGCRHRHRRTLRGRDPRHGRARPTWPPT